MQVCYNGGIMDEYTQTQTPAPAQSLRQAILSRTGHLCRADVARLPSLTLAYVGDTFYDLYVRTATHKFLWNVAWKLDYSFASDLWESASWQAQLRNGGTRFGHRTVEDYLHRPRFELYDLRSDPDELHNLASDPGQASLVAEFVAKLQRFQRETDDPWLHKWTYE